MWSEATSSLCVRPTLPIFLSCERLRWGWKANHNIHLCIPVPSWEVILSWLCGGLDEPVIMVSWDQIPRWWTSELGGCNWNEKLPWTVTLRLWVNWGKNGRCPALLPQCRWTQSTDQLFDAYYCLLSDGMLRSHCAGILGPERKEPQHTPNMRVSRV